jgi:DNA-binding GntR family transcriptional regulator
LGGVKRLVSEKFAPSGRPENTDIPTLTGCGLSEPRAACIVRLGSVLRTPLDRWHCITNMSLSRVERTHLSHTVSEKLSRAIIAGKFKPGVKISEPTLSAMLGVSRAPIREALIELEVRGLVEFDAKGRTRVPVLTPRDIEEIYTVRLMIDPVAAALAAKNAKPNTFKALAAIISANKSVKTLADVSRLDAEFHDLIVEATGNRRLLLCWNAVRDQVELWLAQMQMRHQAVTRSTMQEWAESHQLLLDVIRSGDQKKAAEAARRHVANWMTLMPELPADDTGKS